MHPEIQNPSLGLYLDDIPVLDKNAYDIPWFGIHSGALLRGPQGSLYGRNTMGGVLLLRTRPAWAMDGWEGSVEAELDYRRSRFHRHLQDKVRSQDAGEG